MVGRVLFLIGLYVCLASQSVWAEHVPFQAGHVFISVSNGQVQHRDAAGNLLETLDTLQGGFTTGMAFDRLGNLYVTNFNAGNVRKFDNKGGLIGTFGIGYSGSPESILFNRDGNVYVGSVDGDNDIRKFDQFGNPLAQFDVATERRGSDWIDLGADQCTMFYTSEGPSVKRFDVCTNTQLADFNVAPLPTTVAYAVRLLPSGGLLVASTSVIVRLDSLGNAIQVYDASGEDCWFALNLDPDGTSFWSADFCSSNVHKFDIETGQQLLTFNTGTAPLTVFGLVVFGEIAVGSPSSLHGTVGNRTVYLYWNPPPQAVDGYRLRRDDGNSVTTIDLGSSSTSFLDFGLENGRLYRYTVTAVKNGVEGPPSNEVFARPNEFAVSQPPAHSAKPILFLHGICLFEGDPTTASTWDITRHFFANTLHWQFGGTLFYRKTDDPRMVTPQDENFRSDGDFYTVTFGNCQADYDVGREGLLHQADEVQGFIRRLNDAGLNKISLVAHSMGGMAGRSYIADQPQEAVARVLDFVTHVTPHGGAPLASLFQLASRGARDLDFECEDGRLDYGGLLSTGFLEHLRNVTLPGEIRYFAIRGHSHQNWSIPSTPHRFFTQGCLTTHWDGLIPIDSADFGAIPPSAPLGQPPLAVRSVPLLTTNRFHTNQTNDFSAILCALDPGCFILNARSPVDIEITAPDGRSISRQLTAIPAASYMELEDETDHPIATVLIPFPLGGDYTIKVLPKPGVSPTDTFSIEVRRAGTTTVLAQDQQVQDIRDQPFVFTVVLIDVKPGSFPNPINRKSRGRIPVAILSNPDFDAPNLVNRTSLTFGATGNEISLAFCNDSAEDVNRDGFPDLVCHFDTLKANFQTGDTQGVLQGQTVEGILIRAMDSVRVVP